MVIDRRTLLQSALATGLTGVTSLRGHPARVQFTEHPFSLGVASGDPAADGFVLWTRLAPRPLQSGGGMPARPVKVVWDIADDERMQRVIQEGTTLARVEGGHSVHVETVGLKPNRDYFYRFRAGDAESQIGRARTLPTVGADLAQLRFASAGCQEWEAGYYTVWRQIAEENFDFVFHYGDYIYEFATRGAANPSVVRAMPTNFGPCFTVTDYRRRYALYKSDPDLQAAHASCPFIVTFNDHEVTDNWAADTDPRNTPPELFLFRRAAALQAWYEHMPVRKLHVPRGPDIVAYRQFRFGSLATLAALDTRQYRSKQPCGDGLRTGCYEAGDAGRTMLGEGQERWLAELLHRSRETWQILAQQVLFSRLDWQSFLISPTDGMPAYSMDKWDSASAARERLLQEIPERASLNPVVLSGDLHMGLALEIKDDWNKADARCLAVELLATSISSNGDGQIQPENTPVLHAHNPHLKFVGSERGYIRHKLTSNHWQADFQVVERVSTHGLPVVTRKSFVVEAGHPGLLNA
jgi:alkaline phosphatase D